MLDVPAAQHRTHGVGNGFHVDWTNWTNGSHGKGQQIDTVKYYPVESKLKSLCLHPITGCVEVLRNIHDQGVFNSSAGTLEASQQAWRSTKDGTAWDCHIVTSVIQEDPEFVVCDRKCLLEAEPW